jgi:hypothetical protein
MSYIPYAVSGNLLIATLLLPDQVDDLEESVKASLSMDTFNKKEMK